MPKAGYAADIQKKKHISTDWLGVVSNYGLGDHRQVIISSFVLYNPKKLEQNKKLEK